MRPGLVVVGVGFLVLAGGALAAVNLIPGNGATEQDRFALSPVTVVPSGTGQTEIPGTSVADGRLVVSWNASAPIDLGLGYAGACAGPLDACHTLLANWSGAGAASWTIAGALSFPYELLWESNSSRTMNISATATETWTIAPGSPLWSTLLIDGVAVALGAVGAVAVFLGLFLRAGVYKGPPPLVSRSADDAEAIARQPPAP